MFSPPPPPLPPLLMPPHACSVPFQVETTAIAAYLDRQYPEPPMLSPYPEALQAEAQEATRDLFPTMARLIKSKEFDAAVETAFLESVAKLEAFLSAGQARGQFLLGDALALPDCFLIPRLYVMDGALRHFWPDTHKKAQDGHPALAQYMQRAFATEAFTSTKYPLETMIWGWTAARGA